MTKVKICGITCKTEIEFINKYLPDYIGFVFAKSKREVTPQKAADLAAGLSPDIRKVGVFVDMEPEQAAGIASAVGLDALQLHGSEDAAYIKALRRLLRPGTEIWKAVKMGAPAPGITVDGADSRLHVDSAVIQGPENNGTKQSYDSLIAYGADRLILDTYAANSSGGTGRTFDWSLAQQLKERIRLPIILAGGLHPENVLQAIEQVSPFAVDTSSGVEGDGLGGAGVKDEVKVREFIEAVRCTI